MKRVDLEHIVRAVAAITGADRFVIVGSQAILGQFPDAPPALLVSLEADIFTFRDPNDADLIEGSIGEGSPFHQTFGYYAHGVAEETSVLPAGWKERLVPIANAGTGGATALCLETNDLFVAKLVAGRPKDVEYISNLISHGLADFATVRLRLAQTQLDQRVRMECEARLNRLAGARN